MTNKIAVMDQVICWVEDDKPNRARIYADDVERITDILRKRGVTGRVWTEPYEPAIWG